MYDVDNSLENFIWYN